MSKRLTLTDTDIKVLDMLLNEALNGYWSEANIKMELGGDEKIEALLERSTMLHIKEKIK